jgi:hypothetical protein
VAGHYVRCRIANQDNVDARAVDDTRHREIVGRKHRNLNAFFFKLLQDVGGDSLDLFVDRHGGVLDFGLRISDCGFMIKPFGPDKSRIRFRIAKYLRVKEDF